MVDTRWIDTEGFARRIHASRWFGGAVARSDRRATHGSQGYQAAVIRPSVIRTTVAHEPLRVTVTIEDERDRLALAFDDVMTLVELGR